MAKAPQTDLWHCLSYQDARRAIDWLVEAFGFERGLVVEGDDGTIQHAELTFGDAGVMLGQARGSEWETESGAKTARQAGGVTATAYVIVGDPDAHCERAKAAGAEIVRELQDEEYGSRGYSARDPEGNVWTFGTYRPSAPGGTAP
jgi:uncharacterized glyoxalase superfamily protein PhnB